MDTVRWQRLRDKGWRQGDVEEFLRLSPEESAYIELKLRLSDAVRSLRRDRRLTQVELAARLGSSQSRVAKIEGGDPSVSLDLLTRTLLVLGATRRDISRVIGA